MSQVTELKAGEQPALERKRPLIAQWLSVVFLIYLLIVAVGMIGAG